MIDVIVNILDFKFNYEEWPQKFNADIRAQLKHSMNGIITHLSELPLNLLKV